MNKQELDLLNIMKKEAYVNQRQLSEASGYSLGKVNTSLAELVKAGYLNADYRLTEQAKELFTENRPNQAVILAAGAGMRMIPINTEVSKGMLEVRGETLVERLIKQLKEKGISSNIDDLVSDLKDRDRRDMERSVAPLKPAEGARILDSSGLTLQETIDLVLAWYRESKA